MSMTHEDSMRSVLREHGLCGHTTGSSGARVACILELGHDGGEHEPATAASDPLVAHVPTARDWLSIHEHRRCGDIPPRALAALLVSAASDARAPLATDNERPRGRVKLADEDAAKYAAERDRLRNVIKTGGALYRLERAAMGIPGGVDEEGQSIVASESDYRAWYTACVEAAGIMYEADGHASQPGPVEAVARTIRENVAARDAAHDDIDRIRTALGLDVFRSVDDVIAEIADARGLLQKLATGLGCVDDGSDATILTEAECVRQLVEAKRCHGRENCDDAEGALIEQRDALRAGLQTWANRYARERPAKHNAKGRDEALFGACVALGVHVPLAVPGVSIATVYGDGPATRGGDMLPVPYVPGVTVLSSASGDVSVVTAENAREVLGDELGANVAAALSPGGALYTPPPVVVRVEPQGPSVPKSPPGFAVGDVVTFRGSPGSRYRIESFEPPVPGITRANVTWLMPTGDEVRQAVPVELRMYEVVERAAASGGEETKS